MYRRVWHQQKFRRASACIFHLPPHCLILVTDFPRTQSRSHTVPWSASAQCRIRPDHPLHLFLPLGIGPMVFFLLQAVGIAAETYLLSLAQSLGVKKGNTFLRWMGYLWVLLWLSWTLPFWTDAQHKYGMREWMPRVSLIHRFWKGQWVWT